MSALCPRGPGSLSGLSWDSTELWELGSKRGLRGWIVSPSCFTGGEGTCPGSRSQEEAWLTHARPASQPRDPSFSLFLSCSLPEPPLPRALRRPPGSFLLGPLSPQVPVPTTCMNAVLRATGGPMAISSPPARMINVSKTHPLPIQMSHVLAVGSWEAVRVPQRKGHRSGRAGMGPRRNHPAASEKE